MNDRKLSRRFKAPKWVEQVIPLAFALLALLLLATLLVVALSIFGLFPGVFR